MSRYNNTIIATTASEPQTNVLKICNYYLFIIYVAAAVPMEQSIHGTIVPSLM